MNIVEFLPLIADIVFGAKCIAFVSTVNKDLNYSSDADIVLLPVVAAAPTPISLNFGAVCIYVILSFVFIIDDFVKSLLVSHNWCLFFREIS